MASHVSVESVLQGILYDEQDNSRPEPVSNFIGPIASYLSYCEAWGTSFKEIVNEYTEAQLILFSFVSVLKDYKEEDKNKKKKVKKTEKGLVVEEEDNKRIIKPTKKFKEMTIDEYNNYLAGAVKTVSSKFGKPL
ncbi:hypothetical protein M0R19_04510 [Candidatus Pacearchaeota archaeon]|nr:hypothetical protein [Candidatus Pacearchaeota archaeon]